MALNLDETYSLLAKGRATQRAQARKDARENQKLAARQSLIMSGLKLANAAVEKKYGEFFETEDSRLAKRLTDKQTKLKEQEAAYQSELTASGKSAFEYELDLVNKDISLNDDKIGGYVPGWDTMLPAVQNKILYGSAVAPTIKPGETVEAFNARLREFNLSDQAGIRRKLAQQRVDARTTWSEQLDKVDPITSWNNWKKVNPNSRNLLGGALNLIKRSGLVGSAFDNNNKTASQVLAELQTQTDQLEKYNVLRASGFDMQRSLDEINKVYNKPENYALKAIKEEIIEKEVNVPIVDNQGKTTGFTKQKIKVLQGIYSNPANPDARIVKETPITANSGGGNYSQKEVEASKNYVDSITSYSDGEKVNFIDQDFGINGTATVFYKIQNGQADPSTKTIVFDDPKDELNHQLYKDPSLVNLSSEQKTNGFEQFLAVTGVQGNLNVFFPDPEKFEKQIYEAKTDTQAYKDRSSVIGGKTLLTTRNVRKDLTDAGFTFKGGELPNSFISKVAVQTNLIDGFIGNSPDIDGQFSSLKGNAFEKSGPGQNIEPAKLLLSLALLDQKGSLSAIPRQDLEKNLNNFITENMGESFSGNKVIYGSDTNETRYFNSHEVELIQKLAVEADKLNPSRESILRKDFYISLDENKNPMPIPPEMIEEIIGSYKSGKKTEIPVIKTNLLQLMTGADGITSLRETIDEQLASKESPLTTDTDKGEGFNIDITKAAGAVGDDLFQGAVTQNKMLRSLFSRPDSPNSLDSPDSLDRMVNFMLQRVQDNEDIGDIKEGPMNKILREARNITPEEREQFIRDSLAIQIENSDRSLLSKTEDTETVPDTVPETVEDKVEFVGNILGDNDTAIEFMKRVVNQESLMGKAPGTYEPGGDAGVAQVNRVAFNQVMKKLNNRSNRLSKVIKPFEDATGINLTEVQFEDLNDNDLLSIAFGRLYLRQRTSAPIPKSLEKQAPYYKKYYNTSAGAGTVKKFINTNLNRA